MKCDPVALIAKLVRLEQEKPRRKRWDPQGHKRWLKKVWGSKQVSWVDKYLKAEREGSQPVI